MGGYERERRGLASIGVTLLATTDMVPGKRVVEVKGLVQGNAVRARGIGRDITAGLRGIKGGNVPEYSQLLAAARAEATGIMIEAGERAGRKRRARRAV